jgi:hypothetical protein
MAASSTLTLRVRTIGDRSIDSVTRKLLKLQATVHNYGSVSSRSLEATNVKWKKHFDSVDKGIQMFGGMLTKFVTKSAKFAALQVGALGVAMMAVHAAFVLGNAAMKAFNWLAGGAAGAVAALTIAASTAAAAIREQQTAMYAFKGGGNYQAASVMMRQLAGDTDLASAGAANLQAAFAAVSKTSTFTAGSANLLKGLMDFASAGKPLEEGVKSAGELIAALQDPKASFGKISEAAKKLGPEMEKALAEAGGKGIKTAEQLKKAILDGTLSAAGGVTGQFDAVNGTLISRFKATFALIKTDFADFGEPFLKPTKELLEDISRTFKRTFDRVSGEIAMFAGAGFFTEIGGVTEKLGDFFVKFIRDYLPKVDGMFSSLGSWWDRFKSGWNMILEKLRPLIDGAKVFEETLLRVLRPIGASLADAFGGFNEQVIANADKFYDFGDAIGRFVVVMSKYASVVRDIFIDALPFITKIVNGLTGMVDMFMSLLGGFRDLMGGGGMSSFMLIAKLLVGGRAMKKTTGGVLASYGLRDTTQAKIDRGPLTGQTAGGNVTEGGKARAERLAKTAQSVNQQRVMQMSVQSMTVMSSSDKETTRAARKKQEREAKAERVAKAQAKEQAKAQVQATRSAATAGTAVPTALGNQPAAQLQKAGIRGKIAAYRDARRAAKADFEANRGTIKLPQYDPVGPTTYADRKNTWFTRNFRMSSQANAEMREQEAKRQAAMPGYQGPGFMSTARGYTQSFRAMRDSAGYKRIFGGDIGTKDKPNIKKGINNSMMAGMGASMGLGLLSNVMPEESQGALALGSAVAMVNPIAGLAIGVIGGAIMGIRGATARKKKEAIAEAKKQSENFMKDVVGTYTKKMGEMLERGTLTKENLKNMRDSRKNQFKDRQRDLDAIIMGTLNRRGRRSMEIGAGAAPTNSFEQGATSAADLARLDLKGYDIMDSDALKEMAKKQKMTGTGIFGSLSDEAYKEAMKNPDAFIAAQREINAVQAEAFDLVTQFGDQRAGSIASSLGKTEMEIRKLATSAGVNLHDSLQTTREQVMKLAEAMVNTSQELRNAAADVFATGTDVFRKSREAKEGKSALNEESFAIRGQIDEFLKGDIFNVGAQDSLDTGLLTYFENFRQNLIAQYGGDVMLADQEFNRLFGKGGEAFKQEGGALQGQESLIYSLVGDELGKVIGAGEAGGTKNIEEFLRSNFLQGGFELGGDVTGMAKAIYGMDAATQQQLFSQTENANLADPGVRQAILDIIQSQTGVTGVTATAYVEPQLEAATAMKDAAVLFKDSTMTFQAASQAIVDELGPGDRRSPFGGIGDSLTSSMGKTLSNHSAINSGIPGKRNITSGYRNYALGSLKSDHVTGRALDMVGDNLVSYRDKMTAAGGLAEFHGKGDSRHLHVVPPQSGSIGDSMTAVSATSASVSGGGRGTSVSNTNNFYITGTNANEIADVVMSKMAMVQKSNEERV